MKISLFLFSIICLATLVSSCKKQSGFSPEHLAGKWKLIETHDEFGGAASQDWQKVPAHTSHYHEFTANWQYIETDSSAGAFQQCSGTYQLTAQNKIEVNSPCETEPEHLTITELAKDTLITDRKGTEGPIRHKYIRSNK